MIPFTINGESKQIPSSWDDVTAHQYIDLVKAGDSSVAKVSAMTGISTEILEKAQITGLDSLIMAISFLDKAPDFGDFTGSVGGYKLPEINGKFNVQFESLGQFEDMRQVMKQMKEGDEFSVVVDCYCKFIAIYLQKIRDGEYDPRKAQAMVSEVKAMPAKEVVITGSFFLLKLASLLSGTAANSQPTAPSQKKSKQVLKSSTPSSGSTRRSTKSR